MEWAMGSRMEVYDHYYNPDQKKMEIPMHTSYT